VNRAVPSVFAPESIRGRRRPISFQSFGSFSVTSAGGVNVAAFTASSPKVARRRDPPSDTTPRSTVIFVAGTPHSSAAAATSIARATAPA